MHPTVKITVLVYIISGLAGNIANGDIVKHAMDWDLKELLDILSGLFGKRTTSDTKGTRWHTEIYYLYDLRQNVSLDNEKAKQIVDGANIEKTRDAVNYLLRTFKIGPDEKWCDGSTKIANFQDRDALYVGYVADDCETIRTGKGPCEASQNLNNYRPLTEKGEKKQFQKEFVKLYAEKETFIKSIWTYLGDRIKGELKLVGDTVQHYTAVLDAHVIIKLIEKLPEAIDKVKNTTSSDDLAIWKQIRDDMTNLLQYFDISNRCTWDNSLKKIKEFQVKTKKTVHLLDKDMAQQIKEKAQ